MFKEYRESIALYGGSFDPPHFGHKLVVIEALECLNIEKVMLMPTFLNPFKRKSYFTTKERLKMTKEMFEFFPNVLVSDFEIQEKKPTPTAITLSFLQKSYKVKYLIIGADNLSSIDKWYNFKWLNEQITWVIATRAGYSIDTHKLRAYKILEIEADISSTEIRNNTVKDNHI